MNAAQLWTPQKVMRLAYLSKQKSQTDKARVPGPQRQEHLTNGPTESTERLHVPKTDQKKGMGGGKNDLRSQEELF